MGGVEGSVVIHEPGPWEVSTPGTPGFDTGTQEKDLLGFFHTEWPCQPPSCILTNILKQNSYLTEICTFEIEQN